MRSIRSAVLSLDGVEPRIAAVDSLLKEWSRADKAYAACVADLQNGGGFNTIKLTASTVFSSTVLDDTNTGGAGNDLFLVAFKATRSQI